MRPIQRLRARADFSRVQRSGRSYPHRLLVLLAVPNELEATRIGVVAGKRVGDAVTRNRAKRLMREAVRVASPRIAPGWDLILIARPGIVPVKLQAVAEALDLLLRQAQVYR